MSAFAALVEAFTFGFDGTIHDGMQSSSSPWSVKVWALVVALIALGIHWGSTIIAAEPKPKSALLRGFPLVGSKVGGEYQRRELFMKHAWDLFREGSRMFKDQIWRVTTETDELIVLPPKFAEEVRAHERVFDRNPSIERLLETRYTGVSVRQPLLDRIVRVDLTHKLSRINISLSKAVDKTVNRELGKPEDWKEVNVIQFLQRVVAIVSGFVFMGDPLCLDEGYIHSAIHFTMDVDRASLALKKWPAILRPFMQYRIPELRTLKEHKRRAYDFLKPVIRERKRLLQLKRAGDETVQLPDDALQWAVEQADNFNLKTDEELAFLQLELSLAAIHTTTNTAAHIIYDIVGRCPEAIPELRREIREVTEQFDGVMTAQALYQMKGVDSVMRESSRTNPGVPHRFIRRMDADFTLSDGTRLPKFAMVAVNALDTFTDESYCGAEPAKYDPFRFVDWRTGRKPDPIGVKNKDAAYQFVSVTKENMWFGWGKHACPGRFFAANEIKLILARLLLDYDIKMPDGQEGRYPNLEVGQMAFPDPSKTILVRRAGNAS